MRWALLFLSLFYQTAAFSAAVTCAADQTDQTATVKYNYDGDTLTLNNNQKIRVIGINTPELSKPGQSNQPHQDYALAAKLRTQQLIKSSHNRIQLRFDTEPNDKYGRRLAHVFLANGQNLSALLLEEGFATHLARPPNLSFINCYKERENRAREKRLRIWQLAQYQTIASESITAATTGFRLIQGKVSKVEHRTNAMLIHLPGKLTIQIMNNEQPYFKNLKTTFAVGQKIQIAGWLHNRHKHFFMRLYHPSALK